MDQREALTKLREYRALLEPHFQIADMYLYGSFATGQQRANSDIDVAVVVKSISGDHLALLSLLWRLRRQVDYRIEPILLESDNDPSGFLSQIRSQGIAIAA